MPRLNRYRQSRDIARSAAELDVLKVFTRHELTPTERLMILNDLSRRELSDVYREETEGPNDNS